MASILLNQCFLHNNADQSDFLAFYTIDRSDSRSYGGQVRPYANGRTRLIKTTQSEQQIPVTLRLVSEDALEKLDEWASSGTVLLYRDHMHRMLKGTYLTLAVRDYQDRSGHDVGLVFQKLSVPMGI